MEEKLKLLLAEILMVPVDSIDASTSPKTQPKWDSLRHMNLMFALEDAYGVRFDDEEIPRLTSVPDIEAALARRRS